MTIERIAPPPNVIDEATQSWSIPLTPHLPSDKGICQVAVIYRRDSDGLEGGATYAIDVSTTGPITVTGIPTLAGYTASVYATSIGGETPYLVAENVGDTVSFNVTGPFAQDVPLRNMGLVPPPQGTGPLAYFLGRILVADDKVLWATEPYQYELVDPVAGYKVLESTITFLGNVVDGTYIGTDTGVFFMAGPFENATLTRVSTRRAPKQTPAQIDMASVLKGEDQGVGVLFMTDGGVCVGKPGGMVDNLTNKIFEFPKSTQIAVMARVQDGLNQFVGVASHPGTPTGSARFGDFVDAEIVRFKGV